MSKQQCDYVLRPKLSRSVDAHASKGRELCLENSIPPTSARHISSCFFRHSWSRCLGQTRHRHRPTPSCTHSLLEQTAQIPIPSSGTRKAISTAQQSLVASSRAAKTAAE